MTLPIDPFRDQLRIFGAALVVSEEQLSQLKIQARLSYQEASYMDVKKLDQNRYKICCIPHKLSPNAFPFGTPRSLTLHEYLVLRINRQGISELGGFEDSYFECEKQKERVFVTRLPSKLNPEQFVQGHTLLLNENELSLLHISEGKSSLASYRDSYFIVKVHEPGKLNVTRCSLSKL